MSVPHVTELNSGEKITAGDFSSATTQPPFRYERVRGRLVVLAPRGPEHRHVSRPFRRKLNAYWDAHLDVVEDVDIEGWVNITDETERIPDICVYLTASNTQSAVPSRVPDLIFEFVSADRSDQERDYIDKRADYHAIGVKEYVIVDRFKKSALILTWQEADYAERVLPATENYTSPLLPGLEVPLSEAFSS